ncbi:MAG TPA: calcium/sodium antiporter [Spirochaetota bacterium]|nr:calcium/sodium antiporter [Spirochaetota bacterium]HOS33540.1 calcium/sodium antiporter [Spirochaetota bacterium]HOS54928.1 calcium/sodium antiporter [Spirochaetota bacterium]HPK61552.1 calcium/sodium antiporter [Spirochaetota bacterium]HQF77271.1 calcium/sodium antiporter [Spirochaetota bacterium]
MVFLNVLLFIVGVGLLWLSSEVVIRNITPIANYFGVKELVITILGVSVLSSLPELSISAFAAAKGNADISIGNVVGSNFVTLTFVSALCALITPMSIKPEIKDRESSWMILSSVAVLILAMDKRLSRIDGIILVVMYIPYIVTVIRQAAAEKSDASEEDGAKKKNKKIWLNFLMEVVAIFGIIFGADLALNNGQALGKIMGIPDLALGAIFFAFGTSLPEMAIALSATFKKKAEISIGEIYSSNIFTALVVLGICCIIMPLDLTDVSILNFDLPFLILAGVVIQIFITTGMKFSRAEALIIMGLYVVFLLNHIFPGKFTFSF